MYITQVRGLVVWTRVMGEEGAKARVGILVYLEGGASMLMGQIGRRQ